MLATKLFFCFTAVLVFSGVDTYFAHGQETKFTCEQVCANKLKDKTFTCEMVNGQGTVTAVVRMLADFNWKFYLVPKLTSESSFCEKIKAADGYFANGTSSCPTSLRSDKTEAVDSSELLSKRREESLRKLLRELSEGSAAVLDSLKKSSDKNGLRSLSQALSQSKKTQIKLVLEKLAEHLLVVDVLDEDVKFHQNGGIHPNQSHPSKYPNQPSHSIYPNQPSHSKYPNQPSHSKYPNQPGQSKYPNQPGQSKYPSQPGLSQYPSQPGLSQYPDQPGLSKYPNQPGLSQYPDQPGQSKYPNQPGLSQYPNQPGLSQYPNQPGLSQYPNQPSYSNYPSQPGQSEHTRNPTYFRQSNVRNSGYPGSYNYPSPSHPKFYSFFMNNNRPYGPYQYDYTSDFQNNNPNNFDYNTQYDGQIDDFNIQADPQYMFSLNNDEMNDDDKNYGPSYYYSPPGRGKNFPYQMSFRRASETRGEVREDNKELKADEVIELASRIKEESSELLNALESDSLSSDSETKKRSLTTLIDDLRGLVTIINGKDTENTKRGEYEMRDDLRAESELDDSQAVGGLRQDEKNSDSEMRKFSHVNSDEDSECPLCTVVLKDVCNDGKVVKCDETTCCWKHFNPDYCTSALKDKSSGKCYESLFNILRTS